MTRRKEHNRNFISTKTDNADTQRRYDYIRHQDKPRRYEELRRRTSQALTCEIQHPTRVKPGGVPLLSLRLSELWGARSRVHLVWTRHHRPGQTLEGCPRTR